MKSYQVVASKSALEDLEGIASFVADKYRPESGHKYVNKILGELVSLSYTADIYPFSRYAVAKEIHSKAKTLSIINHKWTVVFHVYENFIIVDRIIPSKMMVK
jgi:plasmid stabilization system protein ParE